MLIINLILLGSLSRLQANTDIEYSENLQKWIELGKATTGAERFAEVTGNKENRLYYAAAFKTIKHDSITINKLLHQFENYDLIFSSLQNVKKVRRCKNDKNGCWYFELRVFPFRYASIVTPLEALIADTCSDLNFNQVEDTELIDKYRKDKNNFFLIKDRGLSICFKIIKINEENSRVGIIITSKPDVSIPPWLFKMGTRNIVPGFLNDLEKYLVEGYIDAN